ncbi:MAG: hypothetical protein ACOX2F_09230 [bacterium]
MHGRLQMYIYLLEINFRILIKKKKVVKSKNILWSLVKAKMSTMSQQYIDSVFTICYNLGANEMEFIWEENKMVAKKQKLDSEEKKILDAFEKGEMVSSNNLEKEKLKAKQLAKNTLGRTKPVNIRLSINDLDLIQKKAKEAGLPYQTLINLLIRQYNQGEIRLTL